MFTKMLPMVIGQAHEVAHVEVILQIPPAAGEVSVKLDMGIGHTLLQCLALSADKS